MKAAIERIIIKERIRKDVTKISELAADIEKNGLLNPITVMPLIGDELRLLAGLRRIQAAKSLGWTEIEVNVVTPVGAEALLRIEISENEQREPFTFSERDYYRKLLEEVEMVKARERMSLGGKGGLSEGSPQGDTLQQGRVSSIVAEQLGMKKTTYDRAKYLSDNAPPEVIAQLDKGECSIRRAYDELRAKEKAAKQSEVDNDKKPAVIEEMESHIESDNKGKAIILPQKEQISDESGFTTLYEALAQMTFCGDISLTQLYEKYLETMEDYGDMIFFVQRLDEALVRKWMEAKSFGHSLVVYYFVPEGGSDGKLVAMLRSGGIVCRVITVKGV